jgi:hypothetical protein
MLVPLAIARAGVLAESDTFWQTRTGLVIVQEGRIPTTDHFSWTAQGQAWQSNSWAFDVLLGLGYRIGGLTVVALVGAALVMVVGAAALLLARRLGAAPGPAALIMVLGATLAATWLSVRPQLADYAAVPLLVVLLDPVRAGGRVSRQVWAVVGIASLHTVWVNLHGAAPLGIGLILAAYLGHVAGRRRTVMPPRWGWYAGAVCAAFLGTLVNPYGFGVFGQLLRVRTESGDIKEWAPLQPTDLPQLMLFGLSLMGVYAAWRLGRLDLVAMLGALAAGGLVMIRLLPVAALVALPVLAGSLSLPGPAAWLANRRRLVHVGLGLTLVGLAVPAVTAVGHIGQPQYPLAAIRALPTGCRLLNDYLTGGPIILLRPDVMVSLDSRNDVYGSTRLLTHGELERGPVDAAAQLRALGVTCVLVAPTAGIARRLGDDPEWQEVVRERYGVLFVRR